MYLTFLKWLLFVCLMGVGAVCLNEVGVYQDVVAQGWVSTSICVSIVVLFLIGTFTCGLDTFKIGHLSRQHREYDVLPSVSHTLRRSVFLSGILPSLGLLGTVLGMIAMNKAIPSLDMKNVDLGEFAGAMATALYTTAVGIGLQTLLRAQIFLVRQDAHTYGEQHHAHS